MSTQIGGANKLGPGAANGSSAVDVSPARGAKSGEQQVEDYNGTEKVCDRHIESRFCHSSFLLFLGHSVGLLPVVRARAACTRVLHVAQQHCPRVAVASLAAVEL